MLAISERLARSVPEYTVSSGLKPVPFAERFTTPFAGAVQVHQAVWPLEIPGIKGSPISLVAFAREPDNDSPPAMAAMVERAAKLSLSGWAVAVRNAAVTAMPVQNPSVRFLEPR